MAEDNGIIERTLLASKSCMLPPLIDDFDTKQFFSNYNEFRKIIAKENLQLLLDILYQNQYLLAEQAYDNSFIEIRANLLMITCEQIEPKPYFSSNDEMQLLKSLKKITFNHVKHFEDSVYLNCIKWFKETLGKNVWKRQIGKFHSFPMFVEILFSHRKSLINNDLLMFILSVGSNLVSHYDPYYKTIGLKIYRCLMELPDDRNFLEELNIYYVIYNETYPLIQRSNEIDYNTFLYNCLYKIILNDDHSKISNSKWCKYDDVMSKLIQQFSFEDNSELCKLLMNNLIAFCGIGNGKFDSKCLPSIKKDLIQSNYEKYFEELKGIFNEPNNQSARWIRKLMELIIRESVKLFNNMDDTKFFLIAFHSLYIMTIATMKPTDFNETLKLDDFTRKIIHIFMKVIKKFKDNHDILILVLLFLKTIKQHQNENNRTVLCVTKILEHRMLRI